MNKKLPRNLCKNCKKETKRSNTIFCSNQCQRDFDYKEFIERWKNGQETGLKGLYSISRYIRKFLFEKYKNKCSKCGWSEINSFTNKIPLEVDHIDGNFKNNKESNLRLICPNCHSLTSTYKAINKGKGRFERMKRYKEGKSF